MNTIYQPKGRAREYSPLALNIYDGCDHQCQFCYVCHSPGGQKKVPLPRTNLIKSLREYLSRTKVHEQVLLCFTCDPYCKAEEKYGLTREVLIAFLEFKVPCAILTKGGSRCLRDLDLFKRFPRHALKVGASLTFRYFEDQSPIEPGAANPEDRVDTLRRLHAAGIQTWVSFEPVIVPEQTLALMEFVSPWIDQVKLGKLNHDPSVNTDWLFLSQAALRLARGHGMEFYMKADLRACLPSGYTCRPEEMDPDRGNAYWSEPPAEQAGLL